MHYVSFRLEGSVLKQIEKGMKEFNYNTKSDFLRDAIREKLGQLEEERKKEKAWQALFAMKGALKGKSKFKTDEEWRKWRNGEGSKQLLEHLENKLRANKK